MQGSITKATELWPALLIAVGLAAILGPVILYLFRMIIKQHERGIEQRDKALESIMDSHERTARVSADSHERSLKSLGEDLSDAIRKAAEDQGRVVNELVKELRVGRGGKVRGRAE